MSTETQAAPNLSDRWWTPMHVRAYLHFPSVGAARKWMRRHGVRMSPDRRRLTCQAWIDAVVEGRSRGKTSFFSSTKETKTHAA